MTDMRRVGVVGCGQMGAGFAEIWHTLPAWYAQRVEAGEKERAADRPKKVAANDRINLACIGPGGSPVPASPANAAAGRSNGKTAARASGQAESSGPSRNAPCYCGSGKKYKRCHGAPGGPA